MAKAIFVVAVNMALSVVENIVHAADTFDWMELFKRFNGLLFVCT